jgi:hypothetical protein
LAACTQAGGLAPDELPQLPGFSPEVRLSRKIGITLGIANRQVLGQLIKPQLGAIAMVTDSIGAIQLTITHISAGRRAAPVLDTEQQSW